jgi:hypothetical protein
VVACAGGRVLWHRSAKKIRVRLNKCLWQQWWLCCKIARDTCWECLTRCLTLLCYHEKSYVNSTMGSIWPHCKKKQNINTVYYSVLFSQIIFHSTGLYSNIDK